MNDTLSPEDRRRAATSLVAAFAAAFTIALGSFAWAEVNSPAAERTPTLSAAPAAPASASPAADTSAAPLGCGCAEGCKG